MGTAVGIGVAVGVGVGGYGRFAAQFVLSRTESLGQKKIDVEPTSISGIVLKAIAGTANSPPFTNAAAADSETHRAGETAIVTDRVRSVDFRTILSSFDRYPHPIDVTSSAQTLGAEAHTVASYTVTPTRPFVGIKIERAAKPGEDFVVDVIAERADENRRTDVPIVVSLIGASCSTFSKCCRKRLHPI